MKRYLFVFIFVLILILPLFAFLGFSEEEYEIISTNFAGYDIARYVSGDKYSCAMLLNPGEELHDYSPSISDIEKILNCKIFIYIGGESDSEWVENDILPDIDKNKTKVINMMEIIKEKGKIIDEESPESAELDEEEVEEDEHIWTSIENEKILVEEIGNIISELDLNNKDHCLSLKNDFIDKLDELDNSIKNLLANSSKNLIIFADRFPILYFVKEYNLEYDAAFKGCDSSKDASITTIEKLTKKVEDNNISVIFTIELSESNIANTIIENCKNDGYILKNLTFYTMHNVSKDNYKKGLTYVDFMNLNIESLKEALM